MLAHPEGLEHATTLGPFCGRHYPRAAGPNCGGLSARRRPHQRLGSALRRGAQSRSASKLGDSGAGMFSRHLKPVAIAFHETFADSGFSMAGAVAYSFVLSFFPFCIFLGALAGYFGGEPLAKEASARLFELVPEPVAQAIAPEVMAVMGRSRFGLLTFGAFIALFFATSAIESLRAALNVAYRVKERRAYLWCLLESMLFVVVSAVGMLVLTWGVVVGPQVAARLKPDSLLWLADTTWVALI